MPQPKKPADYSAGLKQFSKFLVVGVSNFVISFAVFYLLYNYWKLSSIFYGLLGQAGKDLENLILQLVQRRLMPPLQTFLAMVQVQ